MGVIVDLKLQISRIVDDLSSVLRAPGPDSFYTFFFQRIEGVGKWMLRRESYMNLMWVLYRCWAAK
jgi:hypothetical protein